MSDLPKAIPGWYCWDSNPDLLAFVSIKARSFCSLKYRNQGLLSAGVNGATFYVTEALRRCVLAIKVLEILVFVGLWSNRTEYLKLGQSLAFRVCKQSSLILGVSHC